MKGVSNIFWMYAAIIIGLFALYYFQDSSQVQKVNWTEFEDAAGKGYITKITVNMQDNSATATVTEQGAKSLKFKDTNVPGDKKINTIIPSSEKLQDKIDAWNVALVQEGKPEIVVAYDKGSDFMKFLWYFGPIIVFFMSFLS